MVAGTPLTTVDIGLPDPRVLGALLAAAARGGCDAAASPPRPASTSRRRAGPRRVARPPGSSSPPPSRAAESAEPPLAFWSPEDLGLHGRSRAGRHALPIGGTYRFAGRFPAPPLHARFPGRPAVALPVPDLARCQGGPSFGDVVAARRTRPRARRRRTRSPSTQLGRVPVPGAAHHATSGEARRAGGRPPAVPERRRPVRAGDVPDGQRAAPGSDAGLYHYDGVEHRLERVAAA